jgi:RNA polymerase sigma-70 factor (ECF subfamily)
MPTGNSTADIATLDNSGSTSSGLLERVKGGESDAWRRLVELYTPLIYQWCRHCSLRAEDAADIAQEVFAAVALGMAEFHRDRAGDSFRGWLWTITRNEIRDHARRQRGVPQAQGGTEALVQMAQIAADAGEPSSSTPGGGNEGSLPRRAVELVRAAVEPKTWDAFWLVTAENRDPAAVAQELGLSLKAVYDAAYRVRRRLREEIQGLVDETG